MDLDGIGEDEKPTRSDKLNLEIPTPARRKADEIKRKKADREARGVKGPDIPANRRSPARDIARSLVDDPVYLKKLRKRLYDGIAGPVEIWLWRYAFGDPGKNEEEARRQAELYEKMRADMRAFLKDAPERAKLLELAVTRAPRLLPLPRQPTMEELEAAERGIGQAYRDGESPEKIAAAEKAVGQAWRDSADGGF
jgi:hypothetical protein